MSGSSGSVVVNSDGRADIVTISPESFYAVEIGNDDQEFEIVYYASGATGNFYPACCKGVDLNNIGLVARIVSGNYIELATRVGGVTTTLVGSNSVSTGARAIGDRLKVKYQAGRAYVYFNDVEKINILHTLAEAVAGGTKGGLYIRSTTGTDRFDGASATLLASHQVISVNDGLGIVSGSTGNTAVTFGYTAVTSGSIGGSPLIITGFDSNTVTFTAPLYVDGQQYPNPNGTATVIFSDGTNSSNINSVPVFEPADYDIVLLTTLNKGTGKTIADYVPDLAINDKLIYPTANGLLIFDDSGGEADIPGYYSIFWWDSSASLITLLRVQINGNGEITGVGNLTAKYLSSSFLSVEFLSSGFLA